MTGIEFDNLKVGDLCVLTAGVLGWPAGSKLEVVYTRLDLESVFFKFSGIAQNFNIYQCLNFVEVIDKPMYTTMFKHRFKIGDYIWYMYNNRALAEKIADIIYTDKENKLEYITFNGTTFSSEDRIFRSKEELVKSL